MNQVKVSLSFASCIISIANEDDGSLWIVEKSLVLYAEFLETLSGLRINLEKSVILLVGRVEHAESFAMELECKIGTVPSSYLGLSGAVHKSTTAWDKVEEMFCKRPALWKRNLSRKGEESLLCFYPKHFVQYTYLLHIFASNSEGCMIEVGENTKGLSVGWGSFERSLVM